MGESGRKFSEEQASEGAHADFVVKEISTLELPGGFSYILWDGHICTQV